MDKPVIPEHLQRPIVIFTTFWDANKLMRDKVILSSDKETVYQLNFVTQDKTPSNFSVYSIALSQPSLSKMAHLSQYYDFLPRIDFLCPTYDMLSRYKQDGDWNLYTKKYRELLRTRSHAILEWIDSLEPDHIYVLCCWENTSCNSKCHRQLLMNAIMDSKKTSTKIFPIYRHGGVEVRKKSIPNNRDSNNVNVSANYRFWTLSGDISGANISTGMDEAYRDHDIAAISLYTGLYVSSDMTDDHNE